MSDEKSTTETSGTSEQTEERRKEVSDRRVNPSDRRAVERVGENTNRRSGQWDRRG